MYLLIHEFIHDRIWPNKELSYKIKETIIYISIEQISHINIKLARSERQFKKHPQNFLNET